MAESELQTYMRLHEKMAESTLQTYMRFYNERAVKCAPYGNFSQIEALPIIDKMFKEIQASMATMTASHDKIKLELSKIKQCQPLPRRSSRLAAKK